MKRHVDITDPVALRALAHPTRLALVGLLRAHGTLTATAAARLLGLNSGSCSFHLRQLSKYGLVEEVSAPGRQKPWRATAEVTRWSNVASNVELAAATQVLGGVVAEQYRNLMIQWLGQRNSESTAWQQAAWFGDMMLHVTPEELTALGERVEELVAPYQQRVFASEGRPADSRLVTVLHVAFPREPDRSIDGDTE